MCEVNNYKLDLDEIEENFKFSKGDKFTHKQGNKYKLLPYVANEKNLVSEFTGVVGAFSRLISNRELKEDVNIDYLIEEVADQISEFEGNDSREVFKDIVKSVFIKDNKLVDFDIKTINYIKSTTPDYKIAKFLYDTLFCEDLKKETILHYDRELENIMYKLVLNSLPELKQKETPMDEYKCYLPFIKDLFMKDFTFLINNQELYKSCLKRFLEYYYLFYVSQLAMKLDYFEKADLSKADKIYYTLSWESTSKNRTAYRLGWDLLKSKIKNLFSHAVTLELLNHHGLEDQFGYVELNKIYNEVDSSDISNKFKLLYDSYIENIKDVNWEKFKLEKYQNEYRIFDEVYKLFYAIQFQFENSTTRSRANEAYRNWIIRFIYDNFSKKRGPLGYTLNITEDDIILMTKICINNNSRIKLNTLFDEFELRGLFFDRDSKIKIIQLYEKLNLLEKKSDSGDAQYVKSIL